MTAIVLLSDPAVAQTPAEAGCRASTAKGLAKYVKNAQKAVTKCHKGRDTGKIDSGVNCNDLDEADTKGKLAKSEAKLLGILAGPSAKCDAGMTDVLAQYGRCPVPFQAVDDGGASTGIDDFAEVGACLLAHAEYQIERVASEILGSPTPPLSDDAVKCRATIAKGYTKLVDTIAKERTKCQKTLDKAGGVVGFACAVDAPDGKVAGAVEKLNQKISSTCASDDGRRGLARAAAAAEGIDSCGETIEELLECVTGELANPAGGGLASMAWELPGICPEGGAYSLKSTVGDTAFDVGTTGLGHRLAPVGGYSSVQFNQTCDPDCANCSTASITSTPESCRCSLRSSCKAP